MRNASLLSFLTFISSRIQSGVTPRPAQVSLGSALLLYLAGILRPLRRERGLPFDPLGMIAPSIDESCLRMSATLLMRMALILSRSSTKESIDILERLLYRGMLVSPL